MREIKKILVIDDDDDIREMIKMIVEAEGYEVAELDNGHEVQNELARSEPDLILLDVLLGDMNGMDICRALKSGQATSHIPIIMISATHSGPKMLSNGCQADCFISKPFDIVNLVNQVNIYAV